MGIKPLWRTRGHALRYPVVDRTSGFADPNHFSTGYVLTVQCVVCLLLINGCEY